MAILKQISRVPRSEALSKGFMVDTVRGVLRVRKWPRKYGKPRSELQAWWCDWFRQANKLTKYVDAASQRRAIEITAGSGMYPRDVLLSVMRGRLYTWVDQYGKVWYPMAAIQDISESLDVLAQTVGSVLVRATDRWRPAVLGDPTDVLTQNAEGVAPSFQPAAGGGGGLTQEQLAGSPVTGDNTAWWYVFDVTDYAMVDFTMAYLAFANSSYPQFTFSTDGGSSYRAGASDYRNLYVTKGAENSRNLAFANFGDGAGTSGFYSVARFTNLRAGRGAWVGMTGKGASTIGRAGFANFDGPVTHIRLQAFGGHNFTNGLIHVVGIK